MYGLVSIFTSNWNCRSHSKCEESKDSQHRIDTCVKGSTSTYQILASYTTLPLQIVITFTITFTLHLDSSHPKKAFRLCCHVMKTRNTTGNLQNTSRPWWVQLKPPSLPTSGLLLLLYIHRCPLCFWVQEKLPWVGWNALQSWEST